jgi:hypothetical protein
MLALISALLHVLRSGLQSRSELMLENMALRHQLTVLRRSVPKPRLRNADRWFWILLQQCWSGWARALLIVQPQTVVAWHRLSFRLFWRWKSRPRGGRPTLDGHLITLLRHMWSSNPTCHTALQPGLLRMPVGALGTGEKLAREGGQVGRPEEDQTDGFRRSGLGAAVEGDWKNLNIEAINPF